MADVIEIVPRRAIASPCINVCELDPATGRCRGCARTGDEIGRWTSMTDAERDAVMAVLSTRER